MREKFTQLHVKLTVDYPLTYEVLSCKDIKGFEFQRDGSVMRTQAQTVSGFLYFSIGVYMLNTMIEASDSARIAIIFLVRRSL